MQDATSKISNADRSLAIARMDHGLRNMQIDKLISTSFINHGLL